MSKDAATFDDLESKSTNANDRKAFFLVDTNNEVELLAWLKRELEYIQDKVSDRHTTVKNNHARFKGIQYREQMYHPRDVAQKRVRYMPQMVAPLISDVIEEKTARLLEQKKSIAVIPVHDQEQDKVDSKIAKRFLSHIDYNENIDGKLYQLVQGSKIAGEKFMFIKWNPDKGEEIERDPKSQSAKGPNGSPIVGSVFQGDVDVYLKSTLEVFPQQVKSWDKVEYIFEIEFEQVDKLQKLYPEKKADITQTSNRAYNFETMEDEEMEGYTMKVNFFHRKTVFVPQGYECCFVEKAILKKGPFTYKKMKGLPCLQLSDVENEGELAGDALLNKTKSIASQVNNLTNVIIKHLAMAGSAKWFIDGGSTDEASLNNDISIVKLKPGSRDPRLLQANPVSAQAFEFRKELRQEFYDYNKSNSIVRGEPPAGVDAFVAMQFLSESENRRVSRDVSAINHFVRDMYQMILNVCGQFYKPTDKRTMYLLGENNQWEIKSYKPETLTKTYSIVMQESTALPESKALRTQFILDMAKTLPNFFTNEQLSEMLGFSQAAKFNDLMALSARAAEKENELMMEGKEIPQPMQHEMHHVHWKSHMMQIQDINFKLKTSPEQREAMYDHIRATEMMMMEQAVKNPLYKQLIDLTCTQFPCFFNPPPSMPMPPVDPATGLPMPSAPGLEGAGTPSLTPDSSQAAQAIENENQGSGGAPNVL